MAGTSDNYGLVLPELEDKITDSIPQIAENFSEIDRVMKANEEKIDTDIANTTASFDSKLNSAKGELAANLADTQQQLEEGIEVATKAIFGTYTGDGTKGRTINLGFAPVAVLIINNLGYMAYSNGIRGGLALKGYSMGDITNIEASALTITDTGFTVTNNGTNYTNYNGMRFFFIAFKNGEIMEVS